MKQIVKKKQLLVLMFLLVGQILLWAKTKPIELNVPSRSKGQQDVLQLRCDPIPTVRIAFIGLGERGYAAITRYVHLDGVEIKAICDIKDEYVQRSQKKIKENNLPKAEEYIGKEEWKKICQRKDIDLIYICTDWLSHTPMATYAMEQGKHVAVEVPAAMTISDCWKLVDTAEKTRRHCMMLENVCYDFFELAVLNMAQQGLFGEIMHGEGAYNHDLRSYHFNAPENGGYYNWWRLRYAEKHTGNPYPTHGLGPICQLLNIHRGDRMTHLVSMSTKQNGMTLYAEKKFGKNSKEAKKEYALGDMNNTIIQTAKGKTILIQHDVTSPRPYDRHHVVSGTKGFAIKYPMEGIALEPNAHEFLSKERMDSLLKVYEHPFSKEIGQKARQVGGHGGMDFIMDYRLIYCLRNGLPLDQDVYDAAEWSSLAELTEISVKNNNAPVMIPDFTRGSWNKIQRLKFAE